LKPLIVKFNLKKKPTPVLNKPTKKNTETFPHQDKPTPVNKPTKNNTENSKKEKEEKKEKVLPVEKKRRSARLVDQEV
jgi:hypothetical protein